MYTIEKATGQEDATLSSSATKNASDLSTSQMSQPAILPGDLQKGETFKAGDLTFTSSSSCLTPFPSYDIACQWAHNVRSRVAHSTQ
ncbi:hypothetical protein C8R43DRAFT_1117837 [Mycena crocata]|nr:hypothetical protein C8R43DRAFT_1117837 [Mycena crocata]